MKRVARRLAARPAVAVENDGGTRHLPSIHDALKECQGKREWKQAIKLLDERMAVGRMSERSAIVAHGIVASTLEKAGRWREVLDLLDKMEQRGLTPSHFEYHAALRVLVACTSSSSSSQNPAKVAPEEAMQLMQKIYSKIPCAERNAFTYSIMITARGKLHQWELATDLWDELVSLQARNGPPLDAPVCAAVITACERSGR